MSQPDVVLCISKMHERFRLEVPATVRMEWVTGPVFYCDGCAAMMRRVAEALGVHVAERRIEMPDLDDGRARRLRAR